MKNSRLRAVGISFSSKDVKYLNSAKVLHTFGISNKIIIGSCPFVRYCLLYFPLFNSPASEEQDGQAEEEGGHW